MRYFSTATLLSLTLLTAACSSPGIYGRGYSYYNDAYKSAPGAKPANIGYNYSELRNESVIEDMRYAASDLVNKLEEDIPYDVSAIHLMRVSESPFYTTFDHVLRDELSYRGYELVTRPQPGALPLMLAASETNGSGLNMKEKHYYRELYLAFLVGEQIAADGVYEVPTYGFSGNDVKRPDPEEKAAAMAEPEPAPIIAEKLDAPVSLKAETAE